MQRYANNIATQTGLVVPGATVTVLNYPSLTLATIYSTAAGAAQSNPITTDNLGFFAFYANDGRYSLQVSGNGIAPYQLDDIHFEDQLSLDSGSSPDAGMLTGSEFMPMSRGVGLLQTTITKIATFMLSVFTIAWASGIGAVARSLYAKLFDLPISISDFGATTSATDNGPNINAAIAAAAALGIRTVLVPGGTWPTLTPIVGASKVSLKGEKGLSVIDMSGRTSYVNNDTQALLMYKGTKGAAISLTADALFGATTLSVGSTAGLSVGQMIELTANSTGGYSDTSVGVQQGELLFINALTSTVITLNRAIVDSSGYTVANGAVIAPIMPVQDIEISGIKLIGMGRDPAGLQGGDNGIGVYYGLNVNIRDNITDKVDGRGIYVICCYNWDIERNSTYFQPQGSSGLVNYGIYYGSSIFGRISGNYGVNMRHAIVSGHLSMGLSEKYPGINRFIDVSRNTALNAWLTGIATHNDVEYVTMHHNYVAGCVNGMNARERNAYVTDNVIVGCSTNGIYLSGNPQGIVIARNRIIGCVNGINTSFNAGWVAADIHIEDNTVNGFGALPANATGITFSTASGVTTTNKNISIRRNKVSNLTGPGGNASAIRFNGYISGVIEDNTVNNVTLIGIRIDTAPVAVEVRRNRVTNITGTAFSFVNASTDTFATDNYIKGYTTGYSGISGVTNRNNDDGTSAFI